MMVRDEVQRRIAGLYAIADAGVSAGDPVALAVDALEGGCRLIQLRCKEWSADELLRASREVVGHARRYGATVIINDDAEIAAAAQADGVHLGQLDGPLDRARRILGEGAIIGRSTGDLDSLRQALEDADYVAFGPVFPTPQLSRPNAVRGLDLLRQAGWLAAQRRVPLVAIGGITAERLPEVKVPGVSAWAVIGAIALAEDPVAATRSLL
jgi:thiamine-phosphate pyrophosphorylase